MENLKLIHTTSEIQALEYNNSYNKNHEWGLDTMASLHVTNDLSTLSNIKEAQPVKVIVADGTEYIAKTTGTIQLKMPNYQNQENYATMMVNDVYFVPNIQRKLLSEGKLKEDGFKITSGNDGYKIYNQNNVFCGKFNYINKLLLGKFTQD